MNVDKLAPILAVLLSLASLFITSEYIAIALLLVGLIHGGMSPVTDRAAQAMVYAAILAVPLMGDSASLVPIVGGYVNSFLDTLTVAIAGYGISTLVMDIKSRIMS